MKRSTIVQLETSAALRPAGGEEIDNRTILLLIDMAKEARQFSYAPYNDYNVGSAILMQRSGEWRLFLGANVENAAIWSTVCAERSAIFTAVSAGFRNLLAVAVVGDRDDGNLVTPCGGCRQVMVEFGSAETLIIMGRNNGRVEFRTLGELLPEAFGPANLGKDSRGYMAKQ